MELSSAVGFALVGVALVILIVLVVVSMRTIDRIHREKISSVRDFFKDPSDES